MPRTDARGDDTANVASVDTLGYLSGSIDPTVGSVLAAKQPEPRNAREIADSSWVMEGPWRDPRDFKRSPNEVHILAFPRLSCAAWP
jgi:hypothetical protein